MKALSKSSIYGIRALLFIVLKDNNKGFISIREISKEMDISFHYLTKIFQELTQQGLLTSYRGPKGGIALQKPAEDILLIDIINVLEGKHFFDTCILGLPNCSDTTPCPVHKIWKKVKGELKDEFEHVSLQNLSDKVKNGNMRLTL